MVLYITQPKDGSIIVREKNKCHGCTEKNVLCTVYCTSHNHRLDLLGLRKRTGAIAVLRGLYNPRVDISGLRKRTCAMTVLTVLRGMYSLLHTTQPKVGSIRVKEKNRCHGCTERNVQCTVYCTPHSQRLDLLGLRKRTGAMTVLRGLYSVLHSAHASQSQRLDLLGLRKRTGAVAVLRGL